VSLETALQATSESNGDPVNGGQVVAVHRDAQHRFSKQPCEQIELVPGKGVLGDAHFGVTVQHRSRVAADPTQPNLRQVHLIPTELHERLNSEGFSIVAGAMGENVTTRGIDLFALPRGTRLSFAGGAVIELTGLRNPCGQLNGLAQGLMQACLERDASGKPLLRGGVMAVVVAGGLVDQGARFLVQMPAAPHEVMQRV